MSIFDDIRSACQQVIESEGHIVIRVFLGGFAYSSRPLFRTLLRCESPRGRFWGVTKCGTPELARRRALERENRLKVNAPVCSLAAAAGTAEEPTERARLGKLGCADNPAPRSGVYIIK